MSVGDSTTIATGILTINASGVDAGVNQAGNALDRLTTITRNSYFGLRNIALGFEAVGAAALGTIGAGATAAASWEAGMRRIEVSTLGSQSAVNANGRAIGQLQSQLQAIAGSTPVPIKAIEEVADTVAKLGLSIDQVAPVTKTIIDLNQTTGISFDTLSNGVGKTVLSLGLGADGIARFGSTLFELQRNAPATGEDILTLTQRISGAGAASHITTAEILGISTSIASTGGNVRTNASAIQKFIENIQTSVSSGGANLAEFAKLSGESSNQFVKDWGTDPGIALAKVVSGIGDANDAQGRGQQVLQSLGFTQATQIDSLLKIAQAQKDAGGTAISMQGAIVMANSAWREGNALQGAAKLAYGTTSASIQEARNEVQLAAIGLSAFLLPAIVDVAGFVRNLAAGFLALPSGVRATLAVVLLLVGGISALAGGFLLLLPRFVLARDTLLQLTGSTVEQAGAQTRLTGSNAGMAGSISTLVGMMQELLAIQLVLIGEYESLPEALAAVETGMAGYGAEVAAVATEEEVAAGATSVLSAAMGALEVVMGPVGLVTLAIGAAVAGLTALLAHLGAAHRSAATDTLNHSGADQSLLASLQGTSEEINKNTDAWIINRLAMDGTLNKLYQYGVTTKEVVGAIKGTLSDAQLKDVVIKVQANAPSLGEARDDIGKLQSAQDVYISTARAQNDLNKARQDGVGAANDLGTATDSLNGKMLTNQQIADKEAAAALAYPQALLTREQATLAVKTAEEALATASQNLADKNTILALANDKVSETELQHQINVDKVADAERELANARDDAQRKLAEGESKLVSDNLSHERAILAVAAAQKKLTDVMNPQDSALKLKEATDALTRSELDLVDAQTAVGDAQWYINYLQGEGASARDISDANQLLAKANQDVADKTDKVSDNQKKLSDLQGSAGSIAMDQANAELALSEAQQSVLTSEQQVHDQELTNQKLRTDLANDTAYHTAQLNLKQAQDAVLQSTLDNHAALDALHKIQNGSLEDAFKTAQLGLEGAILSQAQAIVDANKQYDEMHGKFWTTRDQANALSGELTLLGQNANGPVKADLLAMAGQVKATSDRMGQLRDNTEQASNAAVQLGPNIASSAQQIKDATEKPPSGPTFFGFLLGELKQLGIWIKDHGIDVLKFIEKTGAVQFVEQVGGFIGDHIPGHAAGGLFYTPHIAQVAEDGPELILPLTDLARSQSLLEQSGLLSQLQASSSPLAPSMSAGGASVTHIDQSSTTHQGAFAPTVVVQREPDEIVDDYFWRNRVLARSA